MTTRTVNINLDAPVGRLNFTLQRMLDVLRALDAGLQAVTQEQLAETSRFMSFHPSANHSLPLDESRTAAQGWLNNAFLRDAIEAAGHFLDDYLRIFAMLDLTSRTMTPGEFREQDESAATAAQRLHFPQKVQRLNDALGRVPKFSQHVLSLNRARTCLVHRMGCVSGRDTNEGETLVIRFRTVRLVAREEVSGKEAVIDAPNTLIEADSTLELRLHEHTRTFALGEFVELTSYDLYSVIMTLWAYAASCKEAMVDVAQERGIFQDQNAP